jgi:diguanylate cyclase (GGDEF)-like protein
MGPNVQPPDPRFLAGELLGFDPALIRDRGLPCGQAACRPLLEDWCVQPGPDPEQAVVLAGRQMAINELTDRNRELTGTVGRLLEEVTTHKELIGTLRLAVDELSGLVDQLSIDRDTLTMTRNAMRVLFARPEVTHIMERMREQGYTFMMILLDVDKLKPVNDLLGGHDAGDLVLAEQNARIKGLFRRDFDVVGVLKAEEEAREAVETGAGFDVVSRFERGAESVVLSFVPPHPESREEDRKQVVDPAVIKDRIEEGFRDAEVVFPLLLSVTDADIETARATGLQFTIEEGPGGRRTVRSRVSVTYAGVIFRAPTASEFGSLASTIDAQLSLLKASKTKVETSGTITDLTARPHRAVRRHQASDGLR